MANKVFANTREIACKAAAGKTICAMPDVCFTPPDKVPPTPPGVPVPYPNTGMASDTAAGSKHVMISGKEIVLKNKSYFKKSYGDEAGAAQKKGIVTSKNKGKVYFQAWSMDVKIEGLNAARHLDMTTHNHGSEPGQTPPWVYMDTMAITVGGTNDPCKSHRDEVKNKCEKHWKNNTYSTGRVNQAGTKRDICADRECKTAMKCVLVPYKKGCCDGKTPHHVIPAHCFMPPGARGNKTDERYVGCEDYDAEQAPCVCVTGKDKSNKRLQHARVHKHFDRIEDAQSGGVWSLDKATSTGAESVKKVVRCDETCAKAQLVKYHEEAAKIPKGTLLRADSGGKKNPSGKLKVSDSLDGAIGS